MSFEKELKLVKNIIIKAGELILEKSSKSYEINYKPENWKKGINPVTDIDLESEKFITTNLKKIFPKDYVLGEEFGKNFEKNERCWFIDPIDGTNAFIKGLTDYCVAISLMINCKIVLGLVYNPNLGELYYAVKDKGAFLEKNKVIKKIKVSDQKILEKSKVSLGISFKKKSFYEKFFKKLIFLKTYESWSLNLMLVGVANGFCDYGFKATGGMSKWDTSAGQIILEEAGGFLTTIDGKGLNYCQKNNLWDKHLIFSNKELHKKILENF